MFESQPVSRVLSKIIIHLDLRIEDINTLFSNSSRILRSQGNRQPTFTTYYQSESRLRNRRIDHRPGHLSVISSDQDSRYTRQLRVSPAVLVGERRHVRNTAPAGLDRARVNAAAAALRDRDQARAASVVELARDLGLRFREASLLDAREALSQARELGRINITAGTKGGRGREVDRWVPVSESVFQIA